MSFVIKCGFCDENIEETENIWALNPFGHSENTYPDNYHKKCIERVFRGIKNTEIENQRTHTVVTHKYVVDGDHKYFVTQDRTMQDLRNDMKKTSIPHIILGQKRKWGNDTRIVENTLKFIAEKIHETPLDQISKRFVIDKMNHLMVPIRWSESDFWKHTTRDHNVEQICMALLKFKNFKSAEKAHQRLVFYNITKRILGRDLTQHDKEDVQYNILYFFSDQNFTAYSDYDFVLRFVDYYKSVSYGQFFSASDMQALKQEIDAVPENVISKYTFRLFEPDNLSSTRLPAIPSARPPSDRSQAPVASHSTRQPSGAGREGRLITREQYTRAQYHLNRELPDPNGFPFMSQYNRFVQEDNEMRVTARETIRLYEQQEQARQQYLADRAYDTPRPSTNSHLPQWQQ